MFVILSKSESILLKNLHLLFFIACINNVCFTRHAIPNCLDGVNLVPVYQRAQLRVLYAQIWEWAVDDLRAHVLKSEQYITSSFPGSTKSRSKDSLKLHEKRNISKEHNYLASHNSSRLLFSFLDAYIAIYIQGTGCGNITCWFKKLIKQDIYVTYLLFFL